MPIKKISGVKFLNIIIIDRAIRNRIETEGGIINGVKIVQTINRIIKDGGKS